MKTNSNVNKEENILIGERIREIREGMDLTQNKFSEMIDISSVFLGQIERGERSLSIKTLSKIVKFTGASTDYILFGNDNANTTIDKINRILNDCSKEGLNFIYEFTCSINTFLKNENKKL